MTDPAVYRVLDVFFLGFHSLFIAFNLTGWAWKPTRRVHLIVIGATVFSWFGLGAVYGWGYCPFTDWHWDVKRALGQTGLPASYVKYYADRATGMDFSPALVDTVVVGLGLAALVASVWVNLRDSKERPSGDRL